MTTLLRHSLLSTVLVLGLFVAMPAFASAASVRVYVEVNNSYNDYNYNYNYNYYNNYDDDLEPEDFTVRVLGEDVSPKTHRGDEDGKKVSLDSGSYSVRIENTRGYRVNYSSDCSGRISSGDDERCYITLTSPGSYNYSYPSYTYPTYYTAPAAAVTLQKGYIPALPSTGFEPLSFASVVFAFALLLLSGLLCYPYARKALTAVLR